MRIAQVSAHTSPLAPLGGRETGGMNVYVLELSRELARLGYEVDIFTRLMSRRVAHGLDIFVKILVVAYLGLFVWQTGSQAISQTRIHEVAQAGTMFLPIWPSRWIPPIASGLMILTLVLKIIGGIMHGPRPAEPHPEREPV